MLARTSHVATEMATMVFARITKMRDDSKGETPHYYGFCKFLQVPHEIASIREKRHFILDETLPIHFASENRMVDFYMGGVDLCDSQSDLPQTGQYVCGYVTKGRKQSYSMSRWFANGSIVLNFLKLILQRPRRKSRQLRQLETKSPPLGALARLIIYADYTQIPAPVTEFIACAAHFSNDASLLSNFDGSTSDEYHAICEWLKGELSA